MLYFRRPVIRRRCVSRAKDTESPTALRYSMWRTVSTRLAELLLIVGLVTPATGLAAPVLLIFPTLVLIEGSQRSASINILNDGDTAGTFVISWSDLRMTPNGGLQAPEEGLAPMSLQPYVRFSPRRMTLQPGETQIARIAVLRDSEIPKGEYYSHLRVLTLAPDETADERNAEEEQATSSVTVIARTAMAIPIIWRNSEAASEAIIESVEFDQETNALAVNVRRFGELSVRGYLHIVHTGADGTQTTLADPMPLVIYPNLDHRTISVPLNEAVDNTELGAATEIIYSPELDIDGNLPIFASYVLAP